MPIAIFASIGQMTVPKAIRDSLALKPAGRVVLVMADNHAVMEFDSLHFLRRHEP